MVGCLSGQICHVYAIWRNNPHRHSSFSLFLVFLFPSTSFGICPTQPHSFIHFISFSFLLGGEPFFCFSFVGLVCLGEDGEEEEVGGDAAGRSGSDDVLDVLQHRQLPLPPLHPRHEPPETLLPSR